MFDILVKFLLLLTTPFFCSMCSEFSQIFTLCQFVMVSIIIVIISITNMYTYSGSMLNISHTSCLLSHLGDKCNIESAYDAYAYDCDATLNQA